MKKEVFILLLALASVVTLNCAAQVQYTPELDEFIGEWHHNSSTEKATIRIVRKGDTIKLFFKTYWLLPELHGETTYYTVNALSFNDGVMTWFEDTENTQWGILNVKYSFYFTNEKNAILVRKAWYNNEVDEANISRRVFYDMPEDW